RAPLEQKEPATAPTMLTPTPDEMAALKGVETEKGYVEPEDVYSVAKDLDQRITTRRNIEAVAKSIDEVLSNVVPSPGRYQMGPDVRTNPPEWYGIRSQLPKELEQGFGYDELQNIIAKGLAGEPMKPRQQAWWDDLFNWAQKKDGPLSYYDFEQWVNDHGFDI